MKKLLALLFSIFKPVTAGTDPIEEAVWQHLDGAEFSVVLPAASASSDE